MNLRSGALLGAATLLAVGLLAAAQDAYARTNDLLTLTVSFSYTSAATVTLNGTTEVGTTTGSPTVIPAGFYSVDLVSMGCTAVPTFTLAGPGVNIQDNLEGGELTTDSTEVDLEPNSTYTWTVDSAPSVAHTFVTSSQILGTPPPPATPIVGPIDPYTGTSQTVGNNPIVGSQTAKTRGTLTGTVAASGKLSLSFKGKNAGSLAAGRYKISVADHSTHSGFVLRNAKHALVTITGVAFVGKRSVTVDLTPGRWRVTNGAGNTAHTLVVA